MSSARAGFGRRSPIKMQVVTDEKGRVVAAAYVDHAREDDLEVGIQPLPGQRLHEVEVPAAIANLEHPHHLQSFFAAARVETDGRLSLPGVEVVEARQHSAE